MRGIRWFFIIMVVTVIVTTSIGYYLVDNNKESYLAELNSNLSENNTQYSDHIESEIKDIMVLVESNGKIFSSKGIISSSELADVFKLVNEKSGGVNFGNTKDMSFLLNNSIYPELFMMIQN